MLLEAATDSSSSITDCFFIQITDPKTRDECSVCNLICRRGSEDMEPPKPEDVKRWTEQKTSLARATNVAVTAVMERYVNWLVSGCGYYYYYCYCYVLNPELRRKKGQIGRDGLEVSIIDYSSVKCACSA